MAKRKKRLEKGIESLERQIKLHEDKKANALEEGKIELARYYIKEIGFKEKTKKDKKRKLEKLKK